MKRSAFRLTFLTVALLLAGLGYGAYRWVRFTDRANCAAQAEQLTHDLLDQYINQDSRWPASWDELRQTRLPAWGWPDQWPDIEDYIAINFGLTLKDVAWQDEEHFTAGRPVGLHGQGFETGFASHLAQFRYRQETPRGPKP